jgi:hypothetical protein
MKFQLYKERVLCFGRAFRELDDCVKPSRKTEEDQEVRSYIHAQMHNPLGSFEKRIFTEPFSLHTEYWRFLPSLQAVDLLADMETIKQQAEAVKNEIITHCSQVREMMYRGRKEEKLQTPIGPMPFPWHVTFVDFIHNQNGEIVYPFDFWEDCIEVYMMKHLDGMSNKKIAEKYHFKSSAVRGGRQGEELVSKCLDETNRLTEALRNNDFPPLVMRGTKQPILINGKD